MKLVADTVTEITASLTQDYVTNIQKYFTCLIEFPHGRLSELLDRQRACIQIKQIFYKEFLGYLNFKNLYVVKRYSIYFMKPKYLLVTTV